MLDITKCLTIQQKQIYQNNYDWFIIFNSKDSAIAAKKYVQDNHVKVIGYPIELHVPSLYHNKRAPSSQVGYEQEQKMQCDVPSNEQKLKVTDIATYTKQMLFEELANIFLKDVKNRIAGPCIYDFLDPLLHKKSETITKLPNSIPSATNLQTVIEENNNNSASVFKMPRFNRKSISKKDNFTAEKPPAPPLSQPQPQSLMATSHIDDGDEDDKIDIDSNSDDDTNVPPVETIIKAELIADDTPSPKQEKLIIKKPPLARKRRKSSQQQRKKAVDNKVRKEKQPAIMIPKTVTATNSPSSTTSSVDIDIDIENDDDDDNNDQIKPIVIDTNLEFSRATLDQLLLDEGDDYMDISTTNPELNGAWDLFQQQIQDVEDLEYLAIIITERAAQESTKRYGKFTMKHLL